MGEEGHLYSQIVASNDFSDSTRGHKSKKCSRVDRKCSLGARENGGLILNDGRWDGEVDEFRAKCALMWTGLRCGEDIENEDQGNGKNYV